MIKQFSEAWAATSGFDIWMFVITMMFVIVGALWVGRKD
jgi:hypothetical protein